jgi:DUF1680 family protein
MEKNHQQGETILHHPLKDFDLSQIKVTNPYYVNAFCKEISYLKAFDPDRLLAGFLETKGLQPKAEKYPGWESTEIRGHTLGHYLTSIAQAYGATKDKELAEIISYIIEQLKLCQFESGYLSAFEEILFDNVENKRPAWVPWYTMHKIISGLLKVYKITKNQTAYEALIKIGDWVYSRTSSWTEETQKRVLAVEYGGMNDCMYELYKISNKEKHLEAAHKFDELSLFTPIEQGFDILNGRHANTTIPKFLGALNRYKTLGNQEKFYLKASKNFWDMVCNHHSYVTGGNSEWEHFGEPEILDSERTNCNCETCNTYNMLKLSRELFKITGNVKYADFYENTLINAILSSQNPETGMTMYFQPMGTGYFKVYSTPFDKFWCCTGTGMENFTKLNDSIYFQGENNIYVNQYVSSILTIFDNKFKLVQETHIPETDKAIFKIEAQNPTHLKISFRSPAWISGPMTVKLNGQAIEISAVNGYVVIEREWRDKDLLELTLPMKVTASVLPDNKHVAAFRYGPVVLSAALGNEDMTEASTGVMVSIATKNIIIKDFITIINGEIDDWLSSIDKNLMKTEGKLEFTLKNTDEDGKLIFTPHYKQHKERYGMYWNLVKPNSPELQKHLLQTMEKERLERDTVDSIPIGNDQYELEHNIRGELTEVDVFKDYRCRIVQKDGWFSYDIRVSTEMQNMLVLKYHSRLAGEGIRIFVDKVLLAEEVIKPIEPFCLYTKSYNIPIDLTQGKEKVTLTFKVNGFKECGRIFDTIRIVKMG